MVKLGAPVRDYDGKVFCFIEAGKDRATYAMFDYPNPPRPQAADQGRALVQDGLQQALLGLGARIAVTRGRR